MLPTMGRTLYIQSPFRCCLWKSIFFGPSAHILCIALCYCVFWFCRLSPYPGTFIQDASVILLCRWSPGSVSRIQMMAVFLRAWLCCWDDLPLLPPSFALLMKSMCTLVLLNPSPWCQIRNSSAWAAEWGKSPLINPSVGDLLLLLPAWCCVLPTSPAEAL